MIAYYSLKQITESFEPEISEALKAVTQSGWYLQGEATRQFEDAFAHYFGTNHCVGTGNGMDAITLFLLSYQAMGQIITG